MVRTVLGQTPLPNAGTVEQAMRLANDYWIAHNNLGDSGWARGAYNTGNQRAFRVLGERAYHDRGVSWGNANQWKIGPEGPGDADAYACGQTYIDLYRMDLQPLYLANVKSNIDALVASPATNGWTWIDAFYMQGPTLARLGNLTGDTNYYTKLWFMYDYMKTGLGLFDSTASLWYRDDTYTNAVAANGQKVFWSRGNGWVFASLARVLQQLPANAPHYQDYVTMFQTMAPAIKALQGTDGMWRSSLYDTNQFPNPETSGTGLFTYGLTWGVRNGLLPAANYTNTISLAWQGLTNLALNTNGLVGWVQAVGAQPAAVTATSTTDFGVGAFLLACSEIYLLAPDAPAIRPWAGPDQTIVTTNGSTATISLDASQTEIYRGTAVSYTWWEGTTNFASGITASTTLALGSHVISLKVLGSDSVTYTDSMAVIVTTLGFSQAPTNFVTLVTDGAWTWFNDPRALFNNGELYFGYNREADGRTVLSALNLQTGVVTDLWSSSLTLTDDHYVPGLQVKPDGTMLAIYSRHQNDQFFMYRLSTSTNPITPSAWGAEQTNNTQTTASTGMTYSNPFQLSAEGGKIYNFARYLNYNPNVFTSINGGATWSTPQILIQTGSGSTRPYVKYCSDYNQRIDVLYTDAHPDNFTNSLYHMYYQGGAFFKTDGTFLKSYTNLPILHDSGERGSVVYQYSDAAQTDPNQWIPTARAWCWEIAYQTNGNPVCVFQTKVDNVTGSNWFDARIYYYYARWTGSAWQKQFVAQAGRPLYNGQPDYGGGIGLDPQDPTVIYISSDAANPFDLSTTTNVSLGAHYELWRGVTTNGGLTFSWQAVTTNSTVDNMRPYIPRRNGGEPCVLWFRGTYTSYTSFSCSIVGLFTTQVPQTNVASGTWIADTDGIWGDPTKWLNGIIASGSGNAADFSTLDITADRTVTLDSPRTIGTLRFGDASGGQNWFLNSSTSTALTLDTGFGASPSIAVNTNTATIQVSLAGTNGFVKSGPGTLVLAVSNSLSGAHNLDRGIDGNNDDGATRITRPDAIGNASSVNIRNTSVSTAGGATLQLDGSVGSIVITQTFSASCRNNSTRPTIENLLGTNTLAGFMALNVGGSNFNIQSDSGLLILGGTNQYIGSLTGARSYAFFGAGNHLVNGPILNSNNGAPISLTKSGTGTLRLAATNSYGNGTTVYGGALLVNGWITGAVTVATSAILGGVGTIRGTVTVQSGGVLAPGDGVGTLAVSNLVLNSGAASQYGLGSNSDLTAVSSNLTVAGTLSITDSGGFGVGTYVLFTYGKTLTYNGLSVGSAPLGYNYSINTGTAGQVKLVVTSTLTAWQQWQFRYFGCTNCSQAQPDADPFGKGMSNTNQFLAGLNPTNSSSLFRIISAVPQGSDIVVTWQTAGRRTNVLQATGGDASGNYTDAFIDIPRSMTVISGSGDAVTNHTDTGGATNGVSRFYRVRLVP